MVKLEPLNTVAKYNSLERFDDGKYFLSSILSESRSHIALSFPTYWHCLASGVKQMYPHVHRVVYGLAINSSINDSMTKADEINVSKLYNWIKLRLINSRFRFSGSDTYIFMVSVDFFEHLGINFEWIRFVWIGLVRFEHGRLLNWLRISLVRLGNAVFNERSGLEIFNLCIFSSQDEDEDELAFFFSFHFIPTHCTLHIASQWIVYRICALRKFSSNRFTVDANE